MKIKLFKKEKDLAEKQKTPESQKPKKPKRSVLHATETGERAAHDWRLMLLVFVLILLVVVSVDGYLLSRINRGDFFETVSITETNVEARNRKSLIDAANFFQARKERYQNFLSSPTVEIDPSI